MTDQGRTLVVIGGTGFIGSHLVERLASAGWDVRVASRDARWPWGEPPAGVEMTPLDITSRSANGGISELLENAAAVVNLAGVLQRPGLPPDAYRRLHVEGAARVAAAARATAVGAPSRFASAPASEARHPSSAGAGDRGPSEARAGTSAGRTVRLVHVSTTGVLGPTGPSPADESSPPRPSTIYEATKLEGERAALAERGDGLEVVVVRPGLVYGPRDLHLLGLYRSIASGAFRLIAGGKALWQPIHVDDVAVGIEAAIAAPGCDGEVFHLAGRERLAVADLAERIAARLGVRVRRPGLSYGAALAAGALLEAACRPFGWDPPLSRARVRTMTQDRVYSIERAAKRLGFAPRIGIDEGLARTIAWYRENGHLR